MKTARIIFPLLLVFFTLLFHGRAARAQVDSVYISYPNSISGGPGGIVWQLSYNHAGPDLKAVGNITLSIDTTVYPYVRFDPDAMTLDSQAAHQYMWSPGTSPNNDKIWWCNSIPPQIQRGQKDSLFVFGLLPKDPNGNIYDSVITIQWTSYFEYNDCNNLSPIASGSGHIKVIPEPWQNFNPIDTAWATSTVLPDCDPSFNFTVQNRNSYQAAIDHLIFKLLPNATATMRPSEIKAPAGWTIQDVTQDAAYFATSTNAITSRASLGGFVMGLRARTDATPYPIPFVWSAYNGGGILDRDTAWDTASALRVAPCVGSEYPTDDTMSATNARECNFNFNLSNLHSGDGAHAVSRITALRLQITSPANVTWNTATVPNLGWFFTNDASQILTFHAIASAQTESSDSANYGLAGGTMFAIPPKASINDPNPGELVSVHWIDSSGPDMVSSGDVIIKCATGPQSQDVVGVDRLDNCCYRVRVKNSHGPTPSNLHAVTLVMMKPTNGSFDPATFSSNINWASNPGLNNESVQFTSGSGNQLVPGATDTFYFCTIPATPGAAWPLEVLTKEAQTDNTITDDTVANVPGCTPPVIKDSVIHRMDEADCRDTIEIVNNNASPIDTIEVVPQTPGIRIQRAGILQPGWTPVISGGSATIAGSQMEQATSLFFTVNYSGETANTLFDIRVRTIHAPAPVSETDSMLACSTTGGVAPTATQVPITLAVAPNPLRNQTRITLTTGAEGRVDLILLNVLGQTANVIERSILNAGEYHYTLDASALAAGTYYLRLEANGQVITKKLVIER